MTEESSRDRWLILVTIGVGTFMSALDGSVVNTLLPVMASDLHASIAGIEWVSTVYLLVVSSLLLGVGRAGDIYGNKKLYVTGFIVFVLGSALCGLAPSARALIALRGLQAIGAAMLFANAPAILTKSFPPQQRGRALGALGTFTYLGLTVGPSLGGWLSGTFGWRSVFFINVPVGALAITLAIWFIAHDRPEGHKEKFDFKGAFLFMVGLVALLGALNEGHAMGWLDARIVGMFVASVGMFGAFIYVELHAKSPMLDLSLFNSLVFSSTTLSELLNYSSVFSVLFALPFLLIQGRGLTAQHAGLILTAQPIVMAVMAPVSGVLSDRIGSRIPATVGMVILTSGILLLAATIESSPGLIAGALGVIGLGVGLFVSPNNSALMGAAPRQRQGIASGVLATARNVGMVLGIGISGAVFTTMMARHVDAPRLAAMVIAVRASLFVAAGLAAVGTATSWIRAKA
ncbi:MAG TPA: DHA2 family efflux MFS transporter permease subunit [Gemmatimonadaceae bacterium]|nr:DHA2 family efflux MFS transporter permease subunit [Gemmatimonadaceae bacterium]